MICLAELAWLQHIFSSLACFTCNLHFLPWSTCLLQEGNKAGKILKPEKNPSRGPSTRNDFLFEWTYRSLGVVLLFPTFAPPSRTSAVLGPLHPCNRWNTHHTHAHSYSRRARPVPPKNLGRPANAPAHLWLRLPSRSIDRAAEAKDSNLLPAIINSRCGRVATQSEISLFLRFSKSPFSLHIPGTRDFSAGLGENSLLRSPVNVLRRKNSTKAGSSINIPIDT